MGQVRCPVFVFEGDDCFVFLSKEEAESSLEAVDVAAGCYDAFDAEGRRLALRIRRPERSWWQYSGLVAADVERVVIEPAEDGPSGAEDLAARLRKFLGYFVPQEELNDKPVQFLVETVCARERDRTETKPLRLFEPILEWIKARLRKLKGRGGE